MMADFRTEGIPPIPAFCPLSPGRGDRGFHFEEGSKRPAASYVILRSNERTYSLATLQSSPSRLSSSS
jgi:hypothetical protein